MPKLTVNLTTCAIAVLTLLGSPATLAQGQSWFRVELVVFANNSTQQQTGAAAPEQWDPKPTLAYPAASRFLVDPAQVRANKAQFGSNSLLDEYGRQIFSTLNQPQPVTNAAPVQTPAPPTPVMKAAPSPLQPVYAEGAEGAAAAVPTVGAPPVTVPFSPPRPFVILPQGYRELSDKVAQMQRSGRYSILFHETWVQPVESAEASLPIVLDRSGDSQQWPQLQGTIKPYLSRYLQVETNLWLNTAGEYLAGTWRMPPPPFGPRSLIIEEEQVVDVASAMQPMPAAAAGAATDAAVNMASQGAAAGQAATLQPAAGLEGAAAAGTPAIAPTSPYRHAVLLEQTRRMRSGEVHYIDHPMLGAIIKFTPVTAEQLATIAAAEASALGETQLR